jgi:hypothetical protein
MASQTTDSGAHHTVGRSGAVHIKRLGSDLPRRLVTKPHPRRTPPSLLPPPRNKHRLHPSHMRRACTQASHVRRVTSCSARTRDLRADAHQTACTRARSRLSTSRASGGYVDATQAWGVRTARPSSLSSHQIDARAEWRLPPLINRTPTACPSTHHPISRSQPLPWGSAEISRRELRPHRR